jgi:CheY-like chemotaxis protein
MAQSVIENSGTILYIYSMKQANSILVIDDDPLFMLLLKKTIVKYDLAKSVSAFTNGLEAFESLKPIINEPSLLPDIILVDIEMPLMDGWEFLDEFIPLLLKASKKISIYIATSSIAEPDKIKSASYPMIKDYLHKPIDEPILSRIIQDHFSAL